MTHVLIVDDKDENLSLLRALLRGDDYTVTEAHSGVEALASAREAPPDLVISDLLMPEMDGYTLLRHLRMDEQLKSVPFIVFTATYTDPNDRKLALDLGADAFIAKPAEAGAFLATVREVVGKVEARQMQPTPPVAREDETVLREYSEVLVRKLEQKTLQLEETNRNLREEIAARQQAEAALADEAVRRRILVEQSRDGIVVLDEDGKVFEANRRYAEMLGYAPDEMASLHVWDWDTQWTRDELLGMVRSVDAAGAHFETRHRRKDGTQYDVEVSTNGAVCGGRKLVFCVCRDITERKLAEEANSRLATAVEQTTETILITDVDGTIVYANPAFETVSGYPREEAIGRNPRMLKSGRQDEQFYRNLWATLTAGNVWRGHFTNQRKDGTLYEEEATISPVRDAAGKTVNYVAVKRDVTHEALLETQFRQAQKMEAVGRLAGGVAHDFNNLLTVILGYVKVIEDRIGANDDMAEWLGHIREAAHRSAALTRQLLAFARKQTISPRVVDVNDTISSMLKLLRRLIGEDIDLAWLPGADVWPVYIDTSQIDQILANLCVNARDAIDGVGQVTIETHKAILDEAYCTTHADAVPGEYVLLTVSDNGSGMDHETAAQVFEPFFTTKGVGQGTGLGLATVYGIVRQNGGSINVYSERGLGTTFRVYLPRHAGEVRAEEAAEPPVPARGAGETILLVEDEPSIVMLGSMLLSGAGYTVLAAATPDEAFRIADEHAGEIRLLITDVVLPQMNGRDLARELLGRYPEIKCLYMSGYTANSIVRRGMLEEGIDFLAKPFTPSELVAKVHEMVARDR